MAKTVSTRMDACFVLIAAAFSPGGVLPGRILGSTLYHPVIPQWSTHSGRQTVFGFFETRKSHMKKFGVPFVEVFEADRMEKSIYCPQRRLNSSPDELESMDSQPDGKGLAITSRR